MTAWSPSDVVMILTAFFAGVGGLISAWKSTQTKNIATEVRAEQKFVAAKAEQVAAKAEENNQKLDEVHSLTNGNLSRTQEELDAAIKRRDFLEKLVIEITAACPPGTLEKASKAIELKQAQIGKRRRSDLQGEGNNRRGDTAETAREMR